MAHEWKQEDVPGELGRIERTCIHCGQKIRYTVSGDVFIGRTALIDGVWTPMMKRKNPECFGPRMKKTKKERIFTEAQKMTFQSRIVPRRP